METKQNIINDGNTWKVLSSNGKDYYKVTMTQKGLSCECMGFQCRGTCRHVKMVQPLTETQNSDVLLSKLKKIESGTTQLSKIDDYLTDEEFDEAISNGLMVVRNGKVFVL